MVADPGQARPTPGRSGWRPQPAGLTRPEWRVGSPSRHAHERHLRGRPPDNVAPSVPSWKFGYEFDRLWQHPCGRRAPSRTGQPCSGAAARVPGADAGCGRVAPWNVDRQTLRGLLSAAATHCRAKPQWVPRRLAGYPTRMGWVWPGVLGVLSQAVDLFGDFRLGTLRLRKQGGPKFG